MKSKLLAILMSMAMAFTMMPMMGTTAYADDPAPPAPGMALGTDVLSLGSNTSDAATVHMAGTKWRVIGYGESTDEEPPQVASSTDTMTLIAADNLKADVPFSEEGETSDANHYGRSDFKNEIDNLTGTGDIFSAGEKAGIVPRDLEHGDYTDQEPFTNGIAGEKVKDALLWPLSTQEADNMNSELRNVSIYWWLRSPGDGDNYAAVVFAGGSVLFFGDNVCSEWGVRPAFNMNLESVLFTSAAEGGKSPGDVGALNEVGTNTTSEWKLTLESGHDSFKVEDVSTCDGKTVKIKYSGAVAKKGEYISAIIADENDTIKYYGNLIEFADGDSTQGIVKVTIDGKIESTDKLYVFNEQLNGDNKTDYSSALHIINIPSPSGHSMTHHNAVAATCTEDGTVEYWACSDCNKNFSDEQGNNKLESIVDPKTGHKYGPWINLNATQHQKVCQHDKTHVVKENHKWDAGKVTKKATEKQAGTRTYTCTACKDTKTETIPKLKPSAPKISGTLLAKLTAKGKSSLVLTWNKVKGAEGYDIFFIRCGKAAPKKVKTIKGNKTFKWTKKSLKTKKAYKAVVKAYVMKSGKKTYVRTSPMVYAYTAGGTKNYTNAKSVTVKKASISLKVGKTYKIKASVTKLQKGKKLMPTRYAPKLRYVSSNKKIATVSKSGQIRAKAKGNCKVYVIAVNGARKAVTVTVK